MHTHVRGMSTQWGDVFFLARACFGEDRYVSWPHHPMAYVRGCIIHVHLQIYVVTKIRLYLCVVYVGMNVGKRPARLDLGIDVVEVFFDVVIVREVA